MLNFSEYKNLKKIRMTGVVFALIGLYYTIVLVTPLQFEHNPQVWFTPKYYAQFIPFYTAATLLLSGVFLATQHSQANFHLAFFGHTASEEIIFGWIGFTDMQLSLSVIVIFFPLSLIALWLGYFNVLKQKNCQ